MSTVARKRITIGFTFAAVLGGLLAWYLIAGSPNNPTTGRPGAGRGSLSGVSGVSKPFTIEGTAATPMSPGVSVPLDLGVTNPYSVTMSVTTLQVRIQTITAPNSDGAHRCARSDFTVEQKAAGSPELTLPPEIHSSLAGLGLPDADWPRVGMLNRLVNQDGCKGASLTLAYSATGTTKP
jgi:hypothetical protein